MKKLNKLVLKKLAGKEMLKQDIINIMGGYNYDDCCGYECAELWDDLTGAWIGCIKCPLCLNFCCYG